MIRRLSDIFPNAPAIIFSDVKTNYKDLSPSDLYVCLRKFNIDTHDFIPQVYQAKAAGVIVFKDVKTELPTYKVENPEKTLLELVKKVYIFDDLNLIAVTGSQGKTSIANMLGSFLNHHSSAGVIGSKGAFSPNYNYNLKYNALEIEDLYRLLHTFYDRGDRYVVIEAGYDSHYHRRTQGLDFDCIIFSNLDTDYHNEFDPTQIYFDAMSHLFEQIKPNGHAIINQDDSYADELIKHIQANIITFGQAMNSDFRISNLYVDDVSTHFILHHNNHSYSLKTNLLGAYNAYNLAAVFAAMSANQYDYRTVFPLLLSLHIPGRLNKVEHGQPFAVIVDDAHTPNGYLRVLKYIKSMKMGQLIIVAATSREDNQKMHASIGKLLSNEADYVIITGEGSGFDDPYEVTKMMIKDVTRNNVDMIIDRSHAIHQAIHRAQNNDCVLIFGNGAESYQIVLDQRIDFNDIEHAKAAIMSHPLMKLKK